MRLSTNFNTLDSSYFQVFFINKLTGNKFHLSVRSFWLFILRVQFDFFGEWRTKEKT